MNILQVIQDSISIEDTNLHLIYHSSKCEGYLSILYIQLTSSKGSLRSIKIRVSVEGVTSSKHYIAKSDIFYIFTWDKKNVFGQKVYGIVDVHS